MKNHKPINAIIPGFGQRSLKTAFATAFIALLYFPFKLDPTFACIGVIFGMGNNFEDSKRSGGNRLIGTIIGGFLGLAIFWLEHLVFPGGNYLFKVILIFFGIIFLVCASVVFRWPGAVQPGGVVLCIILFNMPDNYVSYTLRRMLDTGIGVVTAILINEIVTRERVDQILGRK